ncbi:MULTISPECIES: lipoprotein insertase outer membrane protein LolB [Francisella]|uniref:Outer-membrane lipoprotein LolB n=1 Tax=Francisella opportunistica TaxID=2016517 RepID=A0A345JPD8_9GAMM|nr:MULTISPECIES: lipoprotein insertase outer membrane protein LolB [Francisella]APC90848.1 Outer membrane lipoprotein LolB precursor [Francisella sp. MA067296]AXH29184.1 outer membrane lipoprotein LolB [Francisella opportunistica]AXH30835.1 outer membrane lipoprotein LolB [Francisella opportunistica]AXH32480.1 outer membrane lipoprotein LolB [Francisella opportunistica]
MSKLKIDIKHKFSLFIALILIISLSSCATTRTNVTAITTKTVFDRETTYNNLFKLKKWQAKGVIGIIYDNQAESANYIYVQDDDNFSIKLYGPLGIGSVEIKGDANNVSLENSKDQKLTAKDPKSLMLEQLGWYVPVDGLKYWIKAIAIPGIRQTSKLNTNNLLSKLSQNGWNISYSNYELVDSKYPLPTKIRMSRDNLILKIVIKSWQI